MALTINTNLSALIVKKNLNAATVDLNNAIERMTTGYKINHAGDNAAGFSIAENWKVQLTSLDIAAQNAAMGADMLSTAEENYGLISTHFQRIRDLVEQAANGTYGTNSLAAIKEEITARLDEIDRVAANTEFNGIALMKSGANDINLQVGIKNDTNSRITLSSTLFSAADAKTLLGGTEKATFATDATTSSTAAAQLTKLDTAIQTISTRVTKIGAAQNRIDSAMSSVDVQTQNLTSSLSTIKDSDVATESSAYIKAQILQQASATLLSTANQSPSIALNLI